MNKKKAMKGVNGTRCTHDNCRVVDTATEFGEVLICRECKTIITRAGWDRLHTKTNSINWIDKISDEGYTFIIYFAIYFIVMAIAWGLSL